MKIKFEDLVKIVGNSMDIYVHEETVWIKCEDAIKWIEKFESKVKAVEEHRALWLKRFVEVLDENAADALLSLYNDAKLLLGEK